ncbi:UNVERIFIED_CONTAM: hypothetical protein NCL1_38107 [Trichonephila clavipes]
MTWTTPELPPPLLTTTPHQWEDVLALDRFNVYRFELVTRQATIRYLYPSATMATRCVQKRSQSVETFRVGKLNWIVVWKFRIKGLWSELSSDREIILEFQ